MATSQHHLTPTTSEPGPVSGPGSSLPPLRPPTRLLIVNPNSTASMTDALKPLLLNLNLPNTTYTFFTGPPASPKSINNDQDCHKSAEVCYPLVKEMVAYHDGVVVACYSVHPLVWMLKEYCQEKAKEEGKEEKDEGGSQVVQESIGDRWENKAIIGIFEASIIHSWEILSTLSGVFSGGWGAGMCPKKNIKWGIITTGRDWEEILTDGVWSFFAGDAGKNRRKEGGEIGKFAGVGTTGLNAIELHDLPRSEVDKRMKEATKELLLEHMRRGNDDVESRIGVMCLGCAGMVGLGEVIGQAAIEVGYRPGELKIVDGVKAGVLLLDSLFRGMNDEP